MCFFFMLCLFYLLRAGSACSATKPKDGQMPVQHSQSCRETRTHEIAGPRNLALS